MKRRNRHSKRTERKKPVLLLPTRKGLREINVRDSRERSQVGRYWNAVARYLRTGDASALRKFRGKHIVEATGRQVPMLTDLDELDRLGNAGVLSFETIYARA